MPGLATRSPRKNTMLILIGIDSQINTAKYLMRKAGRLFIGVSSNRTYNYLQ